MDHLRKQYTLSGITRSELHEDPIVQLRAWFDIALENVPAEWFETNAVTLATASPNGEVSARIVLLKGIEDDGLVFYTNYDSSKGQQLAANPHAALVIYWPHLERQIRVQGEVEKTDRDKSEDYFHSRPRGSQIGAVASRQSQTIASREALEQAARETEAAVGDGAVPLPENWGGYLLRPTQFEFWQGRQNRLHDRIVYRKAESNWRLERLQP